MPWSKLHDDAGTLAALARAGWRRWRQRTSTVGSLVRDRAQATPERILLRFENEAVSWGDFNAGVNAFAAVLRQAGVGREPVALMMENSPTLLMAQIAAAKTGAVAALINTHLSGAPLTHALRASTARHVFTDAACLARAVAPPESASLTLWGQGDPAQLPPHVEPLDAALAAAPRGEPTAREPDPDDPFLMLFTAGTAGNPKPTHTRHRRFTTAGIVLGALLRMTADDVIYAPLPLYHGINNIVGFSVALHSGATFATRRRYSTRACIDDLERHRASVLVYVGELCRHLLNEPRRDAAAGPALRLATGAGLRPDVWEPFRERFSVGRIVEMYGLTEGNIGLLNLAGRPGSVGRPLPLVHGDVRIAAIDLHSGTLARDEHGFLVPCADGEPGELLCRDGGRTLIPLEGYLDAKATASRLIHDAFRRGDRWFRTGDILRRGDDGFLHFIDRAEDVFRDENGLLSSLEAAETLNRAPGVRETIVYAVDVPGTSRRAAMAAVVVDGRFDAPGFHRVAQTLPAAVRPLLVRQTPAIDVTGVLKPRKLELQRQGYDPRRISDPLFVRDEVRATYVPLTGENLDRLHVAGGVVSAVPAG